MEGGVRVLVIGRLELDEEAQPSRSILSIELLDAPVDSIIIGLRAEEEALVKSPF